MVGITYIIVSTVLLLWFCISEPDPINSDGTKSNEYQEWETGQNVKLKAAYNINSAWLTVLSTVITIYSIYKIIQTTNQLRTTNQDVKVDKKMMFLHATLLMIQAFVNVSYTSPRL